MRERVSLEMASPMKNLIVCMVIGLSVVTGVATAKKYPLAADKSVPGARGQVDVGKDDNGNTKVEVEVEHLAGPESLTPPRTAYVVWFQERGSEPMNQGLLRPDKNLKAKFKSVTSAKIFDVFVTAETDQTTKSPGGSEVLRGSVQP
jgi:hypothetical protein